MADNMSCTSSQGEHDNSNVSFCAYFPEHCTADRPFVKLDTAEFVVKLVVYLLIFVGSTFGNIIVIAVVYVYRSKMQSSAYLYLLNLSIAGLLVALGCMWPYFLVSIAHDYPLGSFMCRFHPFLQRKRIRCSGGLVCKLDRIGNN